MSYSKKAFTLVELMIVIAIIGILAAALFPSLTGYLARAKMGAFQSIFTGYQSAYELYSIEHNGDYPPACSTQSWGPVCTDDNPFYAYISAKGIQATHPFGGAISWGIGDLNLDGKDDFYIAFDDDKPFTDAANNQGFIPNDFIMQMDQRLDDGLAYSGIIQGGTGGFIPYTWLREGEILYVLQFGK